jgi:choline dehydrogenase-like flavoprotein
MGAPLAGCAKLLGSPNDWMVFARDRGSRGCPFVTLLLRFPRLRLTAFEAHVSAWVGRAAKTDFIPSPGMRVVGIRAIGDEQYPETVDGHSLPDLVRGRRLAVVDRAENFILFPRANIHKFPAILQSRRESQHLITHVPDALANGAEIRPHCMVSRIHVDRARRATGVTCFDPEGRERFQKAQAVIVAGYSIETPRLLLNSACPGFENGLANSSDCVGRYLMVQAGNVVLGRFDELVRMYKAPRLMP